MRLAIVPLLAAAVLAAPAAAIAAPQPIVTASGAAGMTYAGVDAGETVSVRLDDGRLLVKADRPLEAGAGCEVVTPNQRTVACRAAKLPDGSLKGFQVFLGGGTDAVVNHTAAGMTAHGGDGAHDSLTGGAGPDALYGGAGDYDRVAGNGGSDVLGGGPGADDSVDYHARTAGVRVDLEGDADDGEPGERDQVLADVDDITGGHGDDHLEGNAASNVLSGGDGADVLLGLGGLDGIAGGAGDDLLSHNGLGAAAGDDGAPDNLWASTGADHCVVGPADGDVTTDCED